MGQGRRNGRKEWEETEGERKAEEGRKEKGKLEEWVGS